MKQHGLSFFLYDHGERYTNCGLTIRSQYNMISAQMKYREMKCSRRNVLKDDDL